MGYSKALSLVATPCWSRETWNKQNFLSLLSQIPSFHSLKHTPIRFSCCSIHWRACHGHKWPLSCQIRWPSPHPPFSSPISCDGLSWLSPFLVHFPPSAYRTLPHSSLLLSLCWVVFIASTLQVAMLKLDLWSPFYSLPRVLSSEMVFSILMVWIVIYTLKIPDMDWTMSPKKTCWSSNPWYLSIWLYLKIRLLWM